MESNDKEIDQEYQFYLDERKILIEGEVSQSTSFDKYILTISTGFLGLSITFIKNIVTNIKPDTKCWLILSWFFFATCISSTLFSFLTSQFAYRRQIIIIEEIYEKKNKKINEKNCYSIITNILNIYSIVSFMAGVFFLSIFVLFNL